MRGSSSSACEKTTAGSTLKAHSAEINPGVTKIMKEVTKYLSKSQPAVITLPKRYEQATAATNQGLGLIGSKDILAMVGRQYISRIAYIAAKVGQKNEPRIVNLNLTVIADMTKRDQTDRKVFAGRDF
ncbi:hypothetical protein T07_14685 [Trichinella nelsoni]|uniref:Uncharacterized protein n=1 Tax=Trichinella nelsoni TaxID=6336 RepID=A0A0V0SLB3_9BILA|nr:hypothetical protein T07_14685 [Trichinella nelsoni]